MLIPFIFMFGLFITGLCTAFLTITLMEFSKMEADPQYYKMSLEEQAADAYDRIAKNNPSD